MGLNKHTWNYIITTVCKIEGIFLYNLQHKYLQFLISLSNKSKITVLSRIGVSKLYLIPMLTRDEGKKTAHLCLPPLLLAISCQLNGLNTSEIKSISMVTLPAL